MNVLCLGARVIGGALALDLVTRVPRRDASPAKSGIQRRLDKILAIERRFTGEVRQRDRLRRAVRRPRPARLGAEPARPSDRPPRDADFARRPRVVAAARAGRRRRQRSAARGRRAADRARARDGCCASPTTRSSGEDIEHAVLPLRRRRGCWSAIAPATPSTSPSADRSLGRFRMNLHRERGRAAASIRALPLRIPQLADLHFSHDIGLLAALPRGLVLIGGPTGSGKTTTLAALVAAINERDARHIITVEDPIEYEHPHGRSLIEQVEIGIDAPDFPSALRAAVRQAPDVIVVGEMRDPETMRIALSAAETGHLVFATVHTTDVVGAVSRIADAFPLERQNAVRQELAMALAAVLTQTLVPVRGRRRGARRRAAHGQLRRAAAHSQERAAAPESGDHDHAQGRVVHARGIARAVRQERGPRAHRRAAPRRASRRARIAAVRRQRTALGTRHLEREPEHELRTENLEE